MKKIILSFFIVMLTVSASPVAIGQDSGGVPSSGGQPVLDGGLSLGGEIIGTGSTSSSGLTINPVLTPINPKPFQLRNNWTNAELHRFQAENFRKELIGKARSQEHLDALSIINKTAEQLITSGNWKMNSPFVNRYGLILYNSAPNKFPLSKDFIDKKKKSLKNKVPYIDPDNFTKHVVQNPTQVNTTDYVADLRGISGLAGSWNNFRQSVKEGKFQAAKNPSISAVGILVGRQGLKKQGDDSWAFEMENFLVETELGALPLCPGKSEFEDRHSVVDAYCTGFLSELNGKQVFVTARHCTELKGSKNPANSYVVFGYHMNAKGKFKNLFSKDMVYRIGKALDIGKSNNGVAIPENDYAVLTLDRLVPTDVAIPSILDTNGEAKTDELIALVGHPSGVSQKIDQANEEPAIIAFEGKENLLMRVSTDSNHGHSGSPIYSTISSKVIGILISGKADYKAYNTGKDACAVSRVTALPEDAMEKALSTKRLAHLLKK